MTKKKYSHIIWDWNGTLLDDVNWCMEIMNDMLIKRKLPLLSSISDYHGVFCFPIIEYYRNLKFDFDEEPFETLAGEFITAYHFNNTGDSLLHPNVERVLEVVKKQEITQIILSASKIENLISQVSVFNISHYFDEILGLSDVYARSKIEIGLDYITRNHVEAALVIGDTVHDYELASALGADCILVASGHQNRIQLESCHVPVVDEISEILNMIKT